jgi:hypothetical protein
MKRRNESRQWVWPFGKKKKAAKSARKVSPKAVEAKAKERESERLERKLSDRELEAKLRKHYARGGNLREFLQANPAYSPEKMTPKLRAEFQAAYPRAIQMMRRVGREIESDAVVKKRAARGNPTKFTVKVGSHYEDANTYAQARERARVLSETMNYIGFIYQGTRMVESIDARPGHKRNPTGKSAAYEAGRKALASAASKLGTVNLTPSIAQREDWSHAWKEFMAGWNAEKRRPNPAEAAAEVYEEFHGRPSEEIVTVTEKIHYHKNLAALGELRTLVVVARDGGRVTLSRFKKAILCTNEAKNQMFIRGGDQSVDPGAFGIRNVHEVETLGKVVELAYFTRKDHLGDEGGEAIYFHVAGETNENGKRKMAGWAPDLIYHTIDERLEFSGGSYTIRAEGVDK